MTRIQVLMSPEEKAKVLRAAGREGVSLSGWLRQAALGRLQEQAQQHACVNLEALFSQIDARHSERAEQPEEPDWQETKEALLRSYDVANDP